jgi:tetratricopeptide (TPR) repeat protein
MPKAISSWVIIMLAVIGCGPQTIFVRPGLDTPAQHVANGNRLLELEKWDDACREFQRAKDLDPQNTEAFVGLAVAYGGKGDIESGLKLLDDARRLAVGPEQQDKIKKAYKRLHAMKPEP